MDGNGEQEKSEVNESLVGHTILIVTETYCPEFIGLGSDNGVTSANMFRMMNRLRS